MKKIKDGIISLMILLVGLFLIEATLRLINSDMRNYDIEMWKYAKELKTQDSVLGHRHKKNAEATLQGVEIKLNSQGMRSSEHDPDKKKILFIGSSISLGWGVEREESYPEIVNNKLQEEDLDYQVLNASVGNYNTFRYIENFLRNQTAIEPEIIVINYFLNDAEKLPMGSDNFLIENSQLAASFTVAIKKMVSKTDDGLIEHYNNLYRDKNEGFKIMQNSLERLADYTELNEIKVYFVLIPDIHFLQDYPFLHIHKKMNEVAKDHNFEFIDMYGVLNGIAFKRLQIIPGDSHPNEYGHQLIADKLSNILITDLK